MAYHSHKRAWFAKAVEGQRVLLGGFDDDSAAGSTLKALRAGTQSWMKTTWSGDNMGLVSLRRWRFRSIHSHKAPSGEALGCRQSTASSVPQQGLSVNWGSRGFFIREQQHRCGEMPWSVCRLFVRECHPPHEEIPQDGRRPLRERHYRCSWASGFSPRGQPGTRGRTLRPRCPRVRTWVLRMAVLHRRFDPAARCRLTMLVGHLLRGSHLARQP